MNPSGGQGWAEYRWADANGDHFAQPGEVDDHAAPLLASGGGFNPADPTAVASANLIDPDLKAPRTSEIVAGIDRELFPDFAVSVELHLPPATTASYLPAHRHDAPPTTRRRPRSRGTLPDGTPLQRRRPSSRTPRLVAAGNSGRIATNADDYTRRSSGFELARPRSGCPTSGCSAWPRATTTTPSTTTRPCRS